MTFYDLRDFLRLSMRFYDLLSGFAQIFQDFPNLGSGEKLGVALVVMRFQGLHQGRTVLDPAHQVVVGSARIAAREVEHGKLLFAVRFLFHIRRMLFM